MMYPSTSWFPHLALAFLASCTPQLANGHLGQTNLKRQHHRPGFVSDLKTTWDNLLFYPPVAVDILQVRDVVNITNTPRKTVRCSVGALSLPSSPVRSSSPSPSSARGTSTHNAPGPSTTARSSPTSSPGQPSIWKLQRNHTGSSFFDEWVFFTDADPTHGNVQFIDEPTARSANLVSVNSAGNAIMAVDTTPKVSGNRRSIRITTNYQFTGGLLFLDAVHAPTGCGTWPAFWSNGPNWPNNGEIDIMEGVNDGSINQASVHTAPGCHVSDNQANNNASGTLVGGSDCASAESNNGGCGQQATSLSNTYGPGFNNNGGGVYAMLWDENGVAVYFFPRQSIPSDITSMTPQPQTWGMPFARYPTAQCNPFQYFQQHWAIFDTTLCGDWAGNVWNVAGAPGQEQSCAQRTGFSSCADFVQNSGGSFAQAYWEVRSVRLYQKN